MSEWAFAVGAAFWLGILTSISPCLMATNVTAISFIARRLDRPRYVLLSGVCYTLGQSLAFVLLAALILTSLLSVPTIAYWLQVYMFRVLGPLLVLCGMILLELISLPTGSGRLAAWAQSKAGRGGFIAATLLGILFAMSFCPTTAALFFGSLLPLAVQHDSIFSLPLAYAVGVALPVLGFSLLITFAANRIGAAFKRVRELERFGRYATGGVFLLVGLYFTLVYTLNILPL